VYTLNDLSEKFCIRSEIGQTPPKMNGFQVKKSIEGVKLPSNIRYQLPIVKLQTLNHGSHNQLPGIVPDNSKLLKYLRQIQHPDADDPYFKESYLRPLISNPTDCLPLKEAIRRGGHQQNSDSSLCTHTNLIPLQKTQDGKWSGDNIPPTFTIENDQYPRFFVSLVADWSRPQGGIIHSIQECLRQDDLVHVYLDLDSHSTPITKADVDTIVTTLLGLINQYFDVSHLQTYPEVVIVRNQGSPQHKVHVHIPELTLQKRHLKYVAEKLKGILPLLSEFIDTNYSGCRMVLTKKKADNCSLYYDPEYPPWGGANPEEQLLLLLKTKVRAWDGEVALEPRAQYMYLFTQCRDEQIESHDVITTELQQRMASYIPADGQFDATWEDWGYNLKRRTPGACPVCTGCVHESDNARIKLDKGSIVYWCWRASKPVVMEKFRPPTAEEQEMHQKARMWKLKKLLKYDPPYFVSVDTYEAEYLRPFDLNQRIQVAWSPMDTGKTYQICEFIKKALFQGLIRSFTFLSTRCKFANAIASGLQRRGISRVVNYLDSTVNGESFIIISTESLYQTTEVYDLVVLDEITSCLTQMDSGLHRENLPINRQCLDSMIKDAKYVIAMDADIDERCITTLHHLRPDERIYMQHNTIKKRKGWKIKHWSTKYDWFAQIKSALDAGKNIVIPTSSSQLGEKLLIKYITEECQIPETQVRFYHRGSDDYVEELQDVNTHWKRFRVLIYTSTINVGIDFTEDHYDLMFVYGTKMSNCVRELKQMMGRVRKIKEQTVHVYTNKIGGAGTVPITSKDIKHDMVSAISLSNKEIEERKLGRIKQHMVGLQVKRECSERQDPTEHYSIRGVGASASQRPRKKYYYYLENTIWMWLTIQNIKEKNLSLMYYDSLFRLVMEEQGFEYQVMQGSAHAKGPAAALLKKHSQWEKIKREEHDEKMIALYDQEIPKTILPDELTQIQSRVDNGRATAEDKLTLKVQNLLSDIRPECRKDVTGEQIHKVDPRWLHNAQLLRDLSDLDSYRNDMRKQTYGQHVTTDLLKRVAAEQVARLLGVSSILTDRSTLITDEKIKDRIEEWKQLYPTLKAAFGLRSSLPSGFQGVKQMINSVLKSCLGCELKTVHKSQIRINNQREWKYTYKIDAALEIDTIISYSRVKSPVQSTPSPSSN
jgi:hypothetical protein